MCQRKGPETSWERRTHSRSHRGPRRQHRCGGQSGNRPHGRHLAPARQRHSGPWVLGKMPLRPVNDQGKRAPGMRAPRNTNQFLMREKYQMMHLRSDSVGTDSGSDCDTDLADMDSYLGTLENARGGLMDSLVDSPTSPTSRPPLLEDSMQYFPSEDDVIQSEDFMQKDFIEFCDAVASIAP
ncbi:hypothetical protein GN956_G6182 [Arapaima gigas]